MQMASTLTAIWLDSQVASHSLTSHGNSSTGLHTLGHYILYSAQAKPTAGLQSVDAHSQRGKSSFVPRPSDDVLV